MLLASQRRRRRSRGRAHKIEASSSSNNAPRDRRLGHSLSARNSHNIHTTTTTSTSTTTTFHLPPSTPTAPPRAPTPPPPASPHPVTTSRQSMDLGASLANLSLAEIASMLNTKQQEVLLASISVAARFIQQLQAEEQLQAQEEQQLQQQEEQEQQQQQEQHIQQQQHQQQPHHHQQHQQQHHHRLQQQLLHNNNNNDSATTCDSISINNLSQYDDDDDTQDDEDDEDDEDLMMMQEHHGHHVNDYSSTTDAQTLLKIREFAEELKHRRKSIRLSQKGAAQSLRAFTEGDQPCTDAIIYHFENLQLEPDRAMALIPLLKNWLEWAEEHRLTGKSLPMLCAVTKVPRERKRKVVLFNEKAKQYLEDAFVKNNHPDRYQLDVISQELNIPTRSIRKWFTNRRQRKRFAEKFSPLS